MPRRKSAPPVVPDGYRRLKVVYLVEVPVRTIGVYCLFFGNYFYIGKSVDIRRRISWHQGKINELLAQTLYGRAPKPTGSYPIIISHLIENKHIATIDVCLLNVCETEADALEQEFGWHSFLRCHELNYFCLNKLQYLSSYPILGDF